MKAYLDIINTVSNDGDIKSDRTNTGTISKFGLQFRHNLQDGFPLLTTKKLHVKSIVGELLWFIGCHMKDSRYSHLPKTNVQYLKDNGISIWNEWCDENGDLGNIYGEQYTHWKTNNGNYINQIDELINQLKTNPDSRRMIVMAWNVGELDNMKLPPCHFGYQCYSQKMSYIERNKQFEKYCIENQIDYANMTMNDIQLMMVNINFPTRKLSLKWFQRSVDTFLGLPYNIASYALLTHMLAQQTNHIVYELIGDLGDTHIYRNHMEYVEQQLLRVPSNLPTLKLNHKNSIYDYEFSDVIISDYIAQPNWKNVQIAI